MELPISSAMAACLVLIALPLTIHISARRAMIGVKSGVIHEAAFGDAGNDMLRNSVRAFGNFIEYTPLALILFALVEIKGGSDALLLGVGIAFVLGRVVHGISMTFVPLIPAPRGLAMIVTYAAYAIPAWLLIQP